MDATRTLLRTIRTRYTSTERIYMEVHGDLTGLAEYSPVYLYPRELLTETPSWQIVFPPYSTATVQVSPSEEEEFQALADEWLADTRYESRVQSMIVHPSYQRIVGMGERALPLILQRLERETDHWFPALQAIAGENPVPPEDAGNLDAMTRSWLQWGRRRRLLF